MAPWGTHPGRELLPLQAFSDANIVSAEISLDENLAPRLSDGHDRMIPLIGVALHQTLWQGEPQNEN